ncbi:MAG TPA: glycoside hydrolase family 57 protein, partial [Candidatus Dormibacteraeota bacterium]|nr:glycoside hydrolase family 57 protein [Candidatus Dormibacteraeota bacterium]
MKPLRIAFVWHMHQPYYKDDLTATYLLPWVRLRSSKDYFRMAAILDGYPSIRQTYNLVPSLLAQIEDYVSGDYQDLFLNLSRRPAGDLNPDERRFLLKWMRESPRFPRVQASQRYLQLASRPETEVFTTEDLRDLQVWFNLAWCDPQWVDTDPKLSALKAKDRHFSEEEKHSLLDLQLGMMSKVIPKYRELADRGQIELTFSPYHHPILPLLCHSDTARTAIPDIALPDPRFSHQEDADRQIELGKAACERLLGRQPQGMWPSELAVGESVARLAVRSGISWFLADEDVLARSLDVHLGRDGDGCPHQPDLLYTPYTMDREGGQVGVVFRDGALSNLIGFDYQRMHAIEAVRDFMGRLHRIRDSQGDRDFLVTIALDGENPWDFYARDGHDFLNTLYTELEKDDSIITTTISD